jgi:uncharacterized protein
MSEENVATVRRIYTALAEGGPDAIMEFLHPEVEWRVYERLPEADLYIGHAAVKGFWMRFLEAYQDYRADPEEFLDLGDKVLAVVRHHGRGRHTGLFSENRAYHVWTFAEGKVVRRYSYVTREEALEAAGHRAARRPITGAVRRLVGRLGK